MGRWTSPSATAPLWGTGAVLVLIGVVLIVYAVRVVRRGQGR